MTGFSLENKSGLIAVSPPTFIIFVLFLALAVAPIGLLRPSPLMRLLFLALSFGHLVFTLYSGRLGCLLLLFFHLRLYLPCCRCFLPGLLFKVLADYFVTRLVTVTLAA